MRDIFRDAAVGQVLRFVTRGSVAAYPEDTKDFILPALHTQSNLFVDISGYGADPGQEASHRTFNPRHSKDVSEDQESDETTCAHRSSDGITLVTWYTDTDPANPHNWSSAKKIWTSFLILIYTLSVYIGSSLYTASEPAIVSLYGVSEVVAALGLSLYVIGYGVGPMLFSPLSEVPAIGRNPPYVITYALFVVLCVPTSLVDNFAGLLVLRFLLGFFGSPCLATGGASYGDFYGGREMPYVIALWGGGATLAPALGPLVGGFAVQYKNWRWSSWELLWFTGPVFILMFLALPETSSDKILLQRARRLRTLTGRADLRSTSEIHQEKMATREILTQALIKPWEINIKDPAMLFTTFYTALIYAIYYSFFESFPLVYQDIYGFDLSQLGLAFLAVLAGLFVAVAAYCAYFYWISDPTFAKAEAEGHEIPPEARLRPGLIATFFIPAGLFIYAWTSRPSLHFIISLVGIAISMFGVFIITQCMFIYLPFTYPRYAGSLFAANGFARSVFAAAAILYSRPMFLGMGVAGGVSLLGGLCAGCCAGIYVIYSFGKTLRLRSRFAVA